METLADFKAMLIAGIHKSYGYRGDHTRIKMQVFDVDYTLENIRVTPTHIHFDVVMKPAIMYAFGAQFAPWQGDKTYEQATDKCATHSRLVVIPMVQELVTWQKAKYAELLKAEVKAYEDCNEEEKNGWDEGIALFLHDTLHDELKEETFECWFELVKEKYRPGESEDWYNGLKLGYRAEFGEDE